MERLRFDDRVSGGAPIDTRDLARRRGGLERFVRLGGGGDGSESKKREKKPPSHGGRQPLVEGTARELGGSMKSCPCSILDVREEQILEPSGSLTIRLICNLCGALLDSKLFSPQNSTISAGMPPEAGDRSFEARAH